MFSNDRLLNVDYFTILHCEFFRQVPCDFVTLTEIILNYDFATPTTASSYDIFLCMLGNHLRANPMLWPKLKGRIYSKLSGPKLAAFTDTGLQNLIQLFFVLAHILNFDELVKTCTQIYTSVRIYVNSC